MGVTALLRDDDGARRTRLQRTNAVGRVLPHRGAGQLEARQTCWSCISTDWTSASPIPIPSLGPLKDLQISEGYAVAASSYRQRGWALFTAPDDNAELLAVFKQQVGTPGAIVPFGASLGGLISLKIAEDSRFAPVPGVYSACPPAAGTRAWDEAIDLRLAYDVICKGAGELPTGDQPTPWAYNLDDIPNNLSDLRGQGAIAARR